MTVFSENVGEGSAIDRVFLIGLLSKTQATMGLLNGFVCQRLISGGYVSRIEGEPACAKPAHKWSIGQQIDSG